MLTLIAIAIFMYGVSIFDKDQNTGVIICFVAFFLFLLSGMNFGNDPGVEYRETCYTDYDRSIVCE